MDIRNVQSVNKMATSAVCMSRKVQILQESPSTELRIISAARSVKKPLSKPTPNSESHLSPQTLPDIMRFSDSDLDVGMGSWFGVTVQTESLPLHCLLES
jgi:hypothetical protein